MALTPGVKIGLTALRGVLFDTELYQKIAPLDRAALQVVYESEEYSAIWSRRSALRRVMHEKITALATERGEKPSELRHRFLKRDDTAKDTFARIVAKTMDELVASKSEREIHRLRIENKALQEELSREQAERQRQVPSEKPHRKSDR